MKQKKSIYGGLLLVFVLIATILILTNDTTHSVQVLNAQNSESLPMVEQLSNTDVEGPSCRYGASSWSSADNPFIEESNLGWVLDFGVNFGKVRPDDVEYTPMIRMKQVQDANGNYLPDYYLTTQPLTDNADGLGPIIAANPGQLWLVGNEVDRKVFQDDMMPDMYAIAYHDIYHFIKERDPSAQVAISGLVEVTPGRLQYLDIVWDSYIETYGTTMPVDVWNMHVYILPEKYANGADSRAAVALGTDPAIAILHSNYNPNLCSLSNVYCIAEHDDIDLFAQQVMWMRQWMKDHGQQNKPLILSEFSLLYHYVEDPGGTCFESDEYGDCFPPERVSRFMVDAINYLESTTDTNIGYPADNHKLVQQWLWFTMREYPENAPNALLEDDGTRTLIGETFVNLIQSKALVTSLYMDKVSNPAIKIESPATSVTATLSASVLNNGNTMTTEPITVTFYADVTKNIEIGTAVIPANLTGCARRSESVEVDWPNLAPGTHPYWAEVDGGNTLKGIVLVNPEQNFLPLIKR